MQYRKSTLLLLFSWLIIRLFVAYETSLGNDEVYYTLYAKSLELSYFDHPGLVGWVLNLFTGKGTILLGFFYRLPAILASVANIFIVLNLVKLIKPSVNKDTILLWTASSLYVSVVAGLFILPDSVQITPLLLSIFFFVKSIEENYAAKSLLLAFLFSGLAFLGKYHALFLPFGFVLYALLVDRGLWKNPVFYVGGLINLLFLIPVIAWNYDHDFISFTYHGDRVGFLENGFNLTSFLQFNLGELFYNNPITAFASIVALIVALKQRKQLDKSQLLLVCVALPMIVVFTILSMSKTTLPHWTGPAFVLLLAFMLSLNGDSDKWYQKRRVGAISLWFSLLILGLGYIHVQTGIFGQKSIEKIAENPIEHKNLGKNDFTLDLYNWPAFGEQLFQTIDKNYPEQKPTLVSHKWFPAAHVDFYLAQPHKFDFYCLGTIKDIHQYLYLNKERHGETLPNKLLYVAISTQFQSPNYLKADYPQQELIATIPQYRGGKIVRLAFLYELNTDSSVKVASSLSASLPK